MQQSRRSLSSLGVITPCLVAASIAAACAAAPIDGDDDSGGTAAAAPTGATGGTGGTSSTGGKPGTGGGSVGGAGSTGGTTGGTGGTFGGAGGTTGGAGSTGGTGGTGGTVGGAGSTGGTTGGTGGTTGGTGGTFGGAGGTAAGAGGTFAGTGGGAGTGGTFGRGGGGGSGGMPGGSGGTGGLGGSAGTGTSGTGGSSGSGSGTDPCATTTMPTSGGTPHSSSNASGMAGGLAWTIWTNSGPGTITTYDSPAFSASWNNSGDFLARIGLQWNASKTYDAYGEISAQFSSKKTGSGGGYSYIGIYGWSVSPCVEYYIVDDSFNKMPVNPGNTTNKGTAMIDGGTYTLYTRNTSGTGGSKCGSTSNWVQFYSVRQTARTCGIISITQHFDAWAAAGMALGKMDQAQILVETGGGSGSVEFAVGNVTATTP
jgi:hypothetical protein